MKLKGIQKIYHSEFASSANAGLSGLNSLKAEYNSAQSTISQATSVQDSLAGNPFDPNGLAKKRSASTAIMVAKHVMVHTSAVAPNYQNLYATWSAKDQRYLQSLEDSANGTSGKAGAIGAELANYGRPTSSDVNNLNHYGAGQSDSEQNATLNHYKM